MGILASPQVLPIHSNHNHPLILNHQEIIRSNNSENSNSMSQDYHHHQGIFSAFSNGSFERSAVTHHQDQQQQQQQQHIAQQIRRDKLRLHGFEPPPVPPPPLVGIEEEESSGLPVYDGMLSEMFNFAPGGGAASSTELLDPSSYRSPRQPTAAATAGGGEWYGNNRQGMGNLLGDNSKNHNDRDSIPPQHHHHHHHLHQQQQQHHQISSINADSAAAMQLFLMNPQPRSPSPTPPPSTSSSTLHMLLPNPSTTFNGTPFGTNNTVIPPPQFTWVPDHHTSSGHENNTSHEIGGGIVESQGLSLSLSSLQHLEAAKAEEFRIGDGGLLYFNQGGGGGSSSSSAAAQYHYKNLVSLHQQQPLHLQAGPGHQNQHQIRVGYGSSSSLGTVNALRNSKYVKAAQDLLEEFCSVGRGQFKKNKFSRQNTINPSSNPGSSNGGGGGGAGSSSSTKDLPPLSAADRIEHQRRKVKLLSMLDEVERRYNHYCEQMQMVVNSFDVVMGFGSAVPYTALAQKAMSRHFRCLKDAIAAQLRHSCEVLGEKDAAGNSGITKGETPRLKMLEQSLRQQRTFHQMGMMEQEAWRPQRGLPERSVNILRAWLFEHFLHPYPSDADKHLLARQTGLSRSQVSNWFINARVRLWKPMVEEMYQQEAKDHEQEEVIIGQEREMSNHNNNAQTPTPSTTTTTTTTTTTATTTTAATKTAAPASAAAATTTTTATTGNKRSQINDSENDPSLIAINTQCFSESHAKQQLSGNSNTNEAVAVAQQQPPQIPISGSSFPVTHIVVDDYGTTSGGGNDHMGSTLIRFGTTTTGDVSLTLGLRHAGNMPDNSQASFSLRDFGGC